MSVAIPLQKERYIIAAKKDLCGIEHLLPYALTKDELMSKRNFSEKPVLSSDFFKGIDFIDMGTNSVLRSALGEFVNDLSYSSCYVHGTRKNDIYYELMKSGMGAVITTDFTASCFDDKDDIVFFLIDVKNEYRNACIIYEKNVNLSPLAEEFIEIVKKSVQF